MDRKEFHKLIEKPHSLDEKQIDALNKIIEDHPYFASARLMKILDLIRKKDPKAHQEIQFSSLYIQDKNSIYDELLKIDAPQSDVPAPDISKGPVGIGLGENKIEKNDFTNEILDEINIIGKGVKDTVLESFIETKTTEDKSESPVENKTKEETKETRISEKQSEEKVVEKTENTTKTEVKEEKTASSETKKSLADEVMESLAQMRKEREERLKKMEAFETKENSRKSEVKTSSKATQEAVSQEKAPKKSRKEKKPAPAKTKVKSSKNESKVSSKDSKKKSEQKEEKKAPESKAKSDQKIIESFINKSPRIKPPKESDTNQSREDLSKPSTKLPSNLVSENLANIFEKQGKISKAIAIYKQLILKYPEKKSYFAQKLETLEK